MTRIGAVVGRDEGLALVAEVAFENDRALAAEAEDSGRLRALLYRLAHAAEHGGHADAAADEYRRVTERGDLKAVAERAEHIQLVARLALAEPCCTLALYLKDDAKLGRFPCADRDGAAQQMALAAGNMYELAALRFCGDFGCVQHH